MRIAVYTDCSNLYMSIKNRYRKRLDYRKYINYISEYYGRPEILKAYGAQKANESYDFIEALKKLGFETYWKRVKLYKGNTELKADWNIGITSSILTEADNFDTLMLGSSEGGYADLIRVVRDQGKTVINFSTKPSQKLKDSANLTLNITQDFLL